MKRFGLAISVLTVWIAIAGTYYTCVIKGVCDSESDNEEETVSKPIVRDNKLLKKEEIQVVEVVDTIPNEIEETIIDSTLTKELKIAEIDTLKPSYLEISFQNTLLHRYGSNFKIYKNSPRVKIPYGLASYGELIKTQIKASDAKVNIIGFYDVEEDSIQGINRAEYIKSALLKTDIAHESIVTSAKKATILFNKYNSFLGGVRFLFDSNNAETSKPISSVKIEKMLEKFESLKPQEPLETIDISIIENAEPLIKEKEAFEIIIDQDIKKVDNKPIEKVVQTAKEEAKKVAPKILVLYSNSFKSNKLKDTKQLKSFIKNYKKGQKIKLIGFSNESKSSFDNYQEGLQMANSVKEALKKRGISSKDVVVNATKIENKGGETNKGVTLKIL